MSCSRIFEMSMSLSSGGATGAAGAAGAVDGAALTAAGPPPCGGAPMTRAARTDHHAMAAPTAITTARPTTCLTRIVLSPSSPDEPSDCEPRQQDIVGPAKPTSFATHSTLVKTVLPVK